MGSIAARHASAVVENVKNILAIEILCACQALDFRRESGLAAGEGTTAVHDAVRAVVPMMNRDREIHHDIREVAQLIAEGVLVGAAETAVGALR